MLEIQKNVKLAPYSTFKIGGETKFFVEVQSEEELVEALNYAKENNLKIFILGGGSNVLFSDEGFEGIMIKLRNIKYKIQENLIECGAGLLLSQLVNLAKDESLTGLEWASGIPGTIGGAVWGNAGAFGKSMADVITKVKFLNVNNLEPELHSPEECQFGYRNSIFKKDSNLIITSAIIKLEKGNKKEIEEKTQKILNNRLEKQPKDGVGTAGSFFENPVVEDVELRRRFEMETGNKIVEDKIPAGWIIEEAGFKGKRIGNAAVSEKNANFILNSGGGKAEEIIMLASIIKQKVRNEFKVQLREEVRYVHNN